MIVPNLPFFANFKVMWCPLLHDFMTSISCFVYNLYTKHTIKKSCYFLYDYDFFYNTKLHVFRNLS